MNSMDSPLVSVVMPVFNAECYLADAVESILNQTYENFELLIVDDASTDSSWSLINSFRDPRIKSFKNEKNLGYLNSVNFLFSQSKGDFITFQDADDWSSGQRLSTQIDAFFDDPDLMFCGTQCIHYKKGKTFRRSKYPLLHKDLVLQLERGDTVILCGASVMLKRQLLIDYQGYRIFFDRIGAEHLDWFWRMLLKNKYRNLPDYLYTYRSVSNSFTRKLDLNPLRYHSTQVALLAYWQCKLEGKDMLDNKDSSAKLIREIEAKYRNDESLIYRRVAINQLSFGQFGSYLWCIKESIACKGMTVGNIKLMLLWLPLFIFLYLVPRSVQRKVVENNNTSFLREMGIDVKKIKFK